jgi:hypothetical protein
VVVCVSGWACRLWRDADVAQLPQGFVNREAYEAAHNYGEKSDILRYEVRFIKYRFRWPTDCLTSL